MSTNEHPWGGLATSDGFAKWTEPGDSVKGTVVEVGVGQDLNGHDAPQILVEQEDGEVITITASQAQLRSKLLEARPNVGDTIAVMFTDVEKRAGGKTLKLFDVAVKGGIGGAPTAATVPAGPAGKPSAADLI